MFVVGVDLGQVRDYTAIAILDLSRRGSDDLYALRRLERYRDIPYTDVVQRLEEIHTKLKDAEFVVDATGVGAPVVDMLDSHSVRPVRVYIHGGTSVSFEGGVWKVPKRDLVSTVQILLQNGLLKIAPGPLADVLISEMLNFRMKINPATAHDSYAAWREGDHDDLVLAVALACWWGRRIMSCIDVGWRPDGVIDFKKYYLGPLI